MSCLLPLSQLLRTAWTAGGMRLSRVITLVLVRFRWVREYRAVGESNVLQ